MPNLFKSIVNQHYSGADKIYLKRPDTGQSCETCPNFHNTKSCCTIKNNKRVNRYNICDYHGQAIRKVEKL